MTGHRTGGLFIGITEHNHQVGRPIVEVMHILGYFLAVLNDINELLNPPPHGG